MHHPEPGAFHSDSIREHAVPQLPSRHNPSEKPTISSIDPT